jgi:hypothetical protein
MDTGLFFLQAAQGPSPGRLLPIAIRLVDMYNWHNLRPLLQPMFVQRLYREWRPLCWALLLLLAAQVFFMYKGIENVPFFLYHMYAGAHPGADSQTVYWVKTPAGYVNNRHFSNRQQELLYNTLGYFAALRHSPRDTVLQVVEARFGGRVSPGLYRHMVGSLANGPAAIDSFPAWWGRYFRSVYPGQGPVQVVQGRVSLHPPFRRSPIDSILFTIP